MIYNSTNLFIQFLIYLKTNYYFLNFHDKRYKWLSRASPIISLSESTFNNLFFFFLWKRTSNDDDDNFQFKVSSCCQHSIVRIKWKGESARPSHIRNRSKSVRDRDAYFWWSFVTLQRFPRTGNNDCPYFSNEQTLVNWCSAAQLRSNAQKIVEFQELFSKK